MSKNVSERIVKRIALSSSELKGEINYKELRLSDKKRIKKIKSDKTIPVCEIMGNKYQYNPKLSNNKKLIGYIKMDNDKYLRVVKPKYKSPIKTVKDKYKKFTVSHKLEKDLPDGAKVIGFIQEGKACIEKSDKKEIYSAKTLGGSNVYYVINNKRPNFYKVKGYILIDSFKNEWLGYCSNNGFVIFFLIVALLITSTIGVQIQASIFSEQEIVSHSNNLEEITTESHTNNMGDTTIDKGDGISDLDDMLHSNASTHTLSVPQFSDLYITPSTYVPLINLPQNDILMVYEVYTLNNELVFASEKPIKPNSEDKWYLTGYEKGDYDFIIKAYKSDENGNKGNSVSFNTTIHIQ